MTTRSGTNKLHASAYEYLRNDRLDARTFFAEDKAKLRYNLFGASAGGPPPVSEQHHSPQPAGPCGRPACRLLSGAERARATAGNLNLRKNVPNRITNNVYVSRLDHGFSGNDRLYGRFLATSNNSGILPIFPTPGTDSFHSRTSGPRIYFAFGTWLHSLTPATINEFRFAYIRGNGVNRAGGVDLGLAERNGLNLPG